jgi:hypothetical protein
MMCVRKTLCFMHVLECVRMASGSTVASRTQRRHVTRHAISPCELAWTRVTLRITRMTHANQDVAM